MAATKDLRRTARTGDGYGYQVPEGTLIYGGTIVAVTAALAALPAGSAGTVAVAGVAEQRIDTRQGAAVEEDGQTVRAMRGVFLFPVTGATPANIGDPVYAVDDATLSLDDSAGTRLKAGVIDGIDATGVWVRF
ncbi:hypothetical protein DYI37_11435 [Fulvimarina endophytica]|uniref:DUF2190 family protein n=1 Tax=Fulvimarina endophytica TaxID=2293836 RepID=A0A371X453_9HYPH|nr:hypothetical protein DYI37_11435 [Fulvimarina endophytica]